MPLTNIRTADMIDNTRIHPESASLALKVASAALQATGGQQYLTAIKDVMAKPANLDMIGMHCVLVMCGLLVT